MTLRRIDMAVKLTEQQLLVVKKMVEFAEASASQIYHIMKNHGLDKVEGCYLNLSVDPTRTLKTMNVFVGGDDDFGHINLARGEHDDEFTAYGRNTPEYEKLFASEAVRKAMEESAKREKPLPPDGYWVSNDSNTYSVGSWEWDVNDSLS